MPHDAAAIHGITDDQLVDAPTIDEIMTRLRAVFDKRPCLSYNLAFDWRIMRQSISARGLVWPLWEEWPSGERCIMETYAQFYGDWSEYHSSYTWQRLEAAAAFCMVEVSGDPPRALTDARIAAAVLQYMANTPKPMA